MGSLCDDAAADTADGGDWWVRPAWLAGVAASAGALLLQALLLLRCPRCRRYDEITLCHLAAARLANTVCEYLMMADFKISFVATSFFVMYTDFALVCFMFVFSKNLYDRVVVVFVGPKWRAGVAAAAVWTAAVPNGTVFGLLMYYKLSDAFDVYYLVYATVKFVMLLVNASLFACILRVVFARPGAPVRVALVACALVLLTSLQMLISDLFTVFCDKFKLLNNAFFVINAFQGVHILTIFAMLARRHAARAPIVVTAVTMDSNGTAVHGARETS